MGEGLPGWDDEERDAAPRRRTRPWVLVLAVVPWLVVLGLVSTGAVPGGRATPAPPAGHGGPPAPEDAPAPEDSPSHEDSPAHGDPSIHEDSPAPGEATAPPPAGVGQHGTAPTGAPGLGHAEPHETTSGAVGPLGAVALAVARAWLTDVGPRLEIEGVEPHADLYLEHGIVERIERHGDHAVVGILAVVLVRDGETYARVEPRRLAVPLALGPPARPAGAPWWLGDVDLSATPPTSLVEEEDPAVLLEISEAVAAAGLDGEVLDVARTDDGWWLARTTAEEATDPPTPLWLRPGADGPVVAGLAPDGGDEHDPEE